MEMMWQGVLTALLYWPVLCRSGDMHQDKSSIHGPWNYSESVKAIGRQLRDLSWGCRAAERAGAWCMHMVAAVMLLAAKQQCLEGLAAFQLLRPPIKLSHAIVLASPDDHTE